MKKVIIFKVLGLALGLVSSGAFAYDMEPFINHEMKRVQGKDDIRDLSGQGFQHDFQNLQPRHVDALPLKSLDPQLQNLEPVRASEILGAGVDRPQVGVVKTVDPTLPIQNELADKDLYQKTRNNYRKAVHREFVRRAQAAGVNISGRNIAEEIKDLEDSRVNSAK